MENYCQMLTIQNFEMKEIQNLLFPEDIKPDLRFHQAYRNLLYEKGTQEENITEIVIPLVTQKSHLLLS